MSVRACCSGAPPSYIGLLKSRDDRALSDPRENSSLDPVWTETGRALPLADLDRPTGTSTSRFGRAPSNEGRVDADDSEGNLSKEVLGCGSGLVDRVGGDGALLGLTDF
jgi:hypothetical protein